MIAETSGNTRPLVILQSILGRKVTEIEILCKERKKMYRQTCWEKKEIGKRLSGKQNNN